MYNGMPLEGFHSKPGKTRKSPTYPIMRHPKRSSSYDGITVGQRQHILVSCNEVAGPRSCLRGQQELQQLVRVQYHLHCVRFNRWSVRCRLVAVLLALGSHGSINFVQSIGLRNSGKTGFNALTQRIEPALHAADALKQPGIHQSGNGFAVFVDDDAVLPVLHLVEHFTQVLPESDGAGLGDHGGLAG